MKYISDCLYHFVGRTDPLDHERNYKLLLKIVDEGWITHYPHQKVVRHSISFDFDANLESNGLIIPNVTCYCDIPPEAIGIHATKYGFFGIGLDRKELVLDGAKPISYIPTLPSDFRGGWGTTSGLGELKDLENVWRGSHKHVSESPKNPKTRKMGTQPENFEAAAFAMADVLTWTLAFTKAFNAELPEDHPDNYYREREWRKMGNFQFYDKDIRSVVVHRDFAEQIKTDRPRLASRVVAIPM